jgi:hypothetical protein
MPAARKESELGTIAFFTGEISPKKAKLKTKNLKNK